MIVDDLIAALQAALAAAGLPEPPGGVEVEAAKQREHGDWQTNVALKLSKAARRVAARGRGADRRRARGGAAPSRRTGRDRGSGVHQLLPRADLAARRPAVGRRGRRRLRARRRSGRAPDQPRVRLGQPDRAAARRRRPLGRGRRRDRERARGPGRRGAPRVLPERRRERSSTRSARRSTPAAAAPSSPRTATRASTSSTWPTRMRAELGDDVTDEQAREWGLADVRRASWSTTSRGSACTSTRGSPSGPSTSAVRSPTVLERLTGGGPDLRARWRDVAPQRGARRPTRSGARQARRRDHLPPATISRTTRTSSVAGSITSSTSGAPTTTVR